MNSAELETVRVSTSPTTVVTEVHTAEEATVYVKELDLFVTVKLLDDTPAFSLTQKTLPRSRIFLRVDRWPEATTHQRWQTDIMQHGKLRTNRCPWCLSTSSSSSATPTSPTSVLQEAEHPASTRSESSSSTVWGSPSHEPANSKKKKKLKWRQRERTGTPVA